MFACAAIHVDSCFPRGNILIGKGAGMDAWNIGLLVVAAYVAITTLARLMLRRRNQLMEQFRLEVDKEKRRRDAAEKQAKQQQARRPRRLNNK